MKKGRRRSAFNLESWFHAELHLAFDHVRVLREGTGSNDLGHTGTAV